MHALATLGAGVVLAWLSLPVLVWITGRDAEAEPASRHRGLIRALVLSALLLGVPGLRATLEGSGWGLGGVSDAFGATAIGGASSAHTWALPLPWVGSVVLSGIGGAWLVVVGVRLVSIAQRWRCLRGLLSRARAVGPGTSVHDALEREARASGLPTPELLVSEEVKVPFTARVRRPAIVLSQALAEAAEPEALGLIFRHELSHVSRRDVAVDVGVTLVLALFATHPSARSLARKIRFAREAAVDASVAPSAPRAYAELLVTMAERLQHAAELEVGMDDTELCARVRRILDGPHVRRRGARVVPVVVAFALLACSGAAVPSVGPSGSGPIATRAAATAGFSVRLVARGTQIDYSADGNVGELPLRELILRGEDVLAVRIIPASERDPGSGSALSVALTPQGERAMERGTADNVGRHMAILVGDKIVAAPVIRAALEGPHFQITTNTEADFEALASALGAR